MNDLDRDLRELFHHKAGSMLCGNAATSVSYTHLTLPTNSRV